MGGRNNIRGPVKCKANGQTKGRTRLPRFYAACRGLWKSCSANPGLKELDQAGALTASGDARAPKIAARPDDH
jgi:hypothetical protein